MSTALVTGATGFVGRHVVRALLVRGHPVLALARSSSEAPAATRVARAVGEELGQRLTVIEGDLTRLTTAALAKAGDAETLIHCAGDTTFVPIAPRPFRIGHVDAPLALLRALAGGRLRRWTQVSTAFVCGQREGRVREDEGDLGQAFHNPYERVKLDAETALRTAGSRLGVDVRIARPSIVVGAAPETAGGCPANLLCDFIRALAALDRLARGQVLQLRVAARPAAPFNIVPVQYVAEAIVALAEDPTAAGRTFHVVVSRPPSQAAMLAMITGALGVEGPRLVAPGALDNPSALERRLARMLGPYRSYLQQDVSFDDTGARAVLDRVGITSPTLDRHAVAGLVELALTDAGRFLGALA